MSVVVDGVWVECEGGGWVSDVVDEYIVKWGGLNCIVCDLLIVGYCVEVDVV